MSDTVTIHIDGLPYEMPAGMNLVDAAKLSAHTDIPIFCYHPKMEPVGMCRMCLVEIGYEQRDRQSGELLLDEDGNPQIRWGWKLDTACTNTVRPGMHVRTQSAWVQESRQNILEYLLSSHPLDCPICDKGGECPLQTLTMRYGPANSRMVFEDKLHLDKHIPLGGLIYLDRERCIQCARCIRFQGEVVGDAVLAFYERGRRTQIITIGDPPFDTYFSGNTTDICPVGALTTADFRFGGRPWELENVPTICAHCAVGCNMVASTRLDRDSGGVKVIKRILPRQNDAVNEIWICDKGRFGHHHSLSPSRLATPLIRKKGELVEATWDEALKVAAGALKKAGKNVGFVGGPMLSNEDLYALREMAELVGSRKRGLWPANLGDAKPVAEAGVASGATFTGMGQGDAVLVIASDLEEEAPLWFLQVKQAADRGASVIVANTRLSKLDHYSSDAIRYHYGDAVNVLNSLTASAIANDQLADDLIQKRVNGFDDLAAALKDTPQPYDKAAEALAQADNLIVVVGSDGLTPDEHTALLQAAANFLIITGHVGAGHNGLLPVWPGANTQGAYDLGFSPADTRSMVNRPPDALVIAGADLAADPDGAQVLEKIGFVVYFSLFRDATAAGADVVLPIQSFAERDGTFTNGARRVQRFYQAHGPLSASLPAWGAVAMLGQHLGGERSRLGAALVMKAIAEKVRLYKNMSYGALARVEKQGLPLSASPDHYGGSVKPPTGGTGLQWPVKAEGRGKLNVKPVAAPETVRPADGELLIAPLRRLYDRAPEFAASALMRRHIPVPFVALNDADADRLGVQDGDTVTVRAGSALLTVTAMVDSVAPGGVALLPLRLSAEAMPTVPVVGTVALVVGLAPEFTDEVAEAAAIGD